jgi:tRNA 2-thiouridine synthesizing protein A
LTSLDIATGQWELLRVSSIKCDRFLDLRGLECPIPVVKAREEAARMSVGAVLKIFADESGSLKNFQGWAHAAKNVVLVAQGFEFSENGAYFVYYVRKIL